MKRLLYRCPLDPRCSTWLKKACPSVPVRQSRSAPPLRPSSRRRRDSQTRLAVSVGRRLQHRPHRFFYCTSSSVADPQVLPSKAVVDPKNVAKRPSLWLVAPTCYSAPRNPRPLNLQRRCYAQITETIHEQGYREDSGWQKVDGRANATCVLQRCSVQPRVGDVDDVAQPSRMLHQSCASRASDVVCCE